MSEVERRFNGVLADRRTRGDMARIDSAAVTKAYGMKRELDIQEAARLYAMGHTGDLVREARRQAAGDPYLSDLLQTFVEGYVRSAHGIINDRGF